jgi:hypothetical protein
MSYQGVVGTNVSVGISTGVSVATGTGVSVEITIGVSVGRPEPGVSVNVGNTNGKVAVGKSGAQGGT